jgi:hypothetical protein
MGRITQGTEPSDAWPYEDYAKAFVTLAILLAAMDAAVAFSMRWGRSSEMEEPLRTSKHIRTQRATKMLRADAQQ